MENGGKRAPIVVALTVLVLLLWTVRTEASSFRVARVSEIDSPKRVTCNQEFSVAVTFEYASKVLVDVGIFEEETLRVVQSLTLISGFFGPGNVTFVFNLAAPDTAGVWRLMAATRAWWANSWFSDPGQGEKAFAVEVVSENRFWLNLTSSYAFHVDNLRYEPKDGHDVEILLLRGQHMVLAEPMRPIREGVRHVFDRWSDGVQSNPRVVNLFHDTKLGALYRTQYLLTVDSEFGDPIGGGWYDQDSTAFFAVPSEVGAGTVGVLNFKNVFDRWEGDWSGQESTAAVQMLSPKRVHALWRREQELSLGPTTGLASFSLVLASLFFFIRGARRRCFGRKLSFRLFGRQRIMLAVAVWFMMSSIAITPSLAGGNVTTKVGETYWRHWENVESDTCIIWLGGGIEGPPLIVNPYWLESYNTMRFVQDLARYYSVLTLERGSSTIFQTALNRTIRAEFYPSMLIHDAKAWATSAGYRYVYVVGYSVGGIAAAREATIEDPEAWSSPNGIVLITVPLEPFVQYASLLRANHLILYGTEMTKSYVDSGRSFYESTPARGQYEDHWLHKEFRIINDVAHEVWTIARTGRYDSEAISVTVNFIERSKSLQLERRKPLLRDASRNLTSSLPTNTQVRVALTDASPPQVVPLGEVFHVSATIRWQKPSNAQGWIVLYSSDADTILSVRQLSAAENGFGKITLLAEAPNRNTHMSLSLLVLFSDNDRWAIPTGDYSLFVKVLVSDSVDLIVKTTLPRIQVGINGASYTSDDMGIVKVAVVRGYCVVEIPPITYLTSRERAIFEGWRDGLHPARRTLKVTQSLQVEALFRLQYYISASSEVGHVAGGGWYDQNATATITVSPPMIRDRVNGTLVIHRFNGWSLDPRDRNVVLTMVVTKPTEVEARWLKVTHGEKEDITVYALEVFASFLLLVVSMAFARTRRGLG